MGFQILSVVRNGPTVQVEYTLTNARFGKDVTFTFGINRNSAHDNLGNTYTWSSNAGSQVEAKINGRIIGDYGLWQSVTFQPNQPIIGSITIKDFNQNATAFSISINVLEDSSSDIVLGSDKFDFVNVPVSQ